MRKLNKKMRQHKLQSHFQILLGSLNFWHLLRHYHTLAGTLTAHQMWKLFIVYHFSASTVHSHMFVHTLVHMFPWNLTVKRSIVFWWLPRLGCVHTTKRPHLSLPEAVPRPLLQGILSTTILVHTGPNKSHLSQEFDRADLKDARVLQHLLPLVQTLRLWSLVRTRIGDVEGSSNHNSLVRLKKGGYNCYLNLKDEYKWQNF